MRRCTVWLARRVDLRPEHLRLLSKSEQVRRERYHRVADQERSASAAVLLRLAVAEATGADPATLEIDRTCPRCGKDHGRAVVGAHEVEVSVSHSGELVAVAVTDGDRVGVDVEEARDLRTEELAATVLAAQEQQPGSPEEFFTLWTRKEAVLKATGEGLAAPLREVVLGPVREPPRLLSYRGEGLVAELFELTVPTGYAGTVAVLGDGPTELRQRDAAELLARGRL